MGIARWNGSTWNSVSTGFDGQLSAMTVYENELYAGGFFSLAGNDSANNIAKWNGTSWSSLGTGLTGIPGYVSCINVFNDELYVSGFFNNAGGIAVNNFARWTTTTGINNLPTNNSIKSYPNPFTEILSVYGTKINGTISLFDLTGKEILKQITNDAETKINTYYFKPGFYLLKYNGQSKIINLKVMKF